MHLNIQIDDALWQEAVKLSQQNQPQTLFTMLLRDYIQRQKQAPQSDITFDWNEWLVASDAFCAEVLRKREGRLLDVDVLLQAARDDLESRHNEDIGY